MAGYTKAMYLETYIEEYRRLDDQEKERFSLACNKLISDNFIYGQRGYEEELYKTILRLKKSIEPYFALMDFELMHDDNYKIFYLRSKIQGTRVKLKKLETVILLILAKLYCTKSLDIGSFDGAEVEIAMSDLTAQIEKTRIFNRMPGKTDIANALQSLKRYKIINVNTSDIASVTTFKLLPTILYVITEKDLVSIENRIKGLANFEIDEQDDANEGDDINEAE